jgi:hypothetical protein
MGEEITISVSQDCQVALPAANLVPEVSVTVTSNGGGREFPSYHRGQPQQS